jgi:hypothetical protein
MTLAATGGAAVVAGRAVGGSGLHDKAVPFVLAATSTGVASAVANLAADGTDQTAALQAAINLAMSAEGNPWLVINTLGVIRVDGQLTFPNDGATPPNQRSLRISGLTAAPNGRGVAPGSGTMLDLRYAGGPGTAKIDTRGVGALTLEHVTFQDTTDGTTDFIHTTNTVLRISCCEFYGKNVNGAPSQDAIILGGTSTNIDGSFQAAFQGYGTVIEQNLFQGIRSCVRGQTYCNGVVVRDNVVWSGCGGDAQHGAFHIVGPVNVDADVGGLFSGNLIEIPNYVYPFYLDGAVRFTFVGNNCYDDNVNTLAVFRCVNNTGFNLILCGQHHTTIPTLSEDNTSQDRNVVITSQQNQTWNFGQTNVRIPAAGSVIEALEVHNGLTLSSTTSSPTISAKAGSGGLMLCHDGDQRLGLFAHPVASQQTVTGNKRNNAALASLLAALAQYGLIIDKTT